MSEFLILDLPKQHPGNHTLEQLVFFILYSYFNFKNVLLCAIGVDIIGGKRYNYHTEKYRIFHGQLGHNFFFSTLGEIAFQANEFCSSHPTEVFILRIKFENAENAENADVIKSFAEALGGCTIAPPRTNPPNAVPLLSEYSITELLALPRGDTCLTLLKSINLYFYYCIVQDDEAPPLIDLPGGVILMHYSVDPIPRGHGHLAPQASKTTAVAWSYQFNLGGKSSEDPRLKVVVPKQIRLLDAWQNSKHEPLGCLANAGDPNNGKPTCNTPMFGIWLTLTGGIRGGIDVQANTVPKIKDNGKYGGYLQQLTLSRFSCAAKAGGVVVWLGFY